MKLASRTADFFGYTGSQTESLRHLRAAGFRFGDYSFGCDYSSRSGIYSEDPAAHLDAVAQTADELGIQLIQAHSPMGRPITENEEQAALIEGTKLCIKACADLGIENIVVHSGYDEGLSKEETFARNKKFYDELLPVAEKKNV